MMRARSPALLLRLALAAGGQAVGAPAAAQSAGGRGPAATLVLTIRGGVVTGGGLWTVGPQPFCSQVGTACQPGAYDTLRLTRTLGASLVAGVGVSYFPSRTLGFQGEITYLGFSLDDGCTVLNGGASRETQQICGSIQGQSNTSGAISFFAGVLARAAAHRVLSPYLRAGVGLVAIDRSTVDVSGIDSTGQVFGVLIDDSPRELAFGAVLGAGLTFALGPGYQFRLEGQDVVSGLDRATGPAGASLRPPIASRAFHHFALTMGLDVVLEQKRGRRY
jgi:opacity protein-like surface antigen